MDLEASDRTAVAERTRRDLERRRRHRAEITLDVEIERAADATRLGARLRNLGLDGARIDTEEALMNGSRLKLELPAPDEGPLLNLEARVVWVLADPEDERWPAGLEFDELDERSRQKFIDRVVAYVLQGPGT